MSSTTISNRIKKMIDVCINVASDDWDDARETIFTNLMDIPKFCIIFDDYVPCKDKDNLYVSETELKTTIRNSICQLSCFNNDVENLEKEEEIIRLIDVGAEIMQRKQMDKYYNPTYSICPCPKSNDISEKQIQQLERFIHTERHDSKYMKLCPSITNSQATYGLTVYTELLNEPNGTYVSFTSFGNFYHTFALYKSLEGKIYVLYSTNEFIKTYNYIDETWFKNFM